MSIPIDKTSDQHVEDSTSIVDMNTKDADVLQAKDFADQFANGRSEAEKRLVRKLDWRILPCCWTLYLLGYLDRANIGY